MSRMRAYLELARVSNLPTVWSNTLVGLYAGYTAWVASGPLLPDGTPYVEPPDYVTLGWFALFGFPVFLAMSCLYTGGMVLNDFLDAEADLEERPHRPIPSGRVSHAAARRFAVLLFLIAVFAIASYGRVPAMVLTLVLGLTIVAYNRYHLASAWMVGVMGLCRALVYLATAAVFPAFAYVWYPTVLPLAGAILVYTALFSLIARQEVATSLGTRRWVAPLIAIVPLLPAFWIRPENPIWAIPAAAALLLWLTRMGWNVLAEPPRTPQAITGWIAGMCLVDAWFLTLLDRPLGAAVAGVFFVLTLLGQRRIAGT